MGQTLAEKIISDRCNKELHADEIVIVPVDICMLQDGTGPLALQQLNRLTTHQVQKTIIFLDHAAPVLDKNSPILIKPYGNSQKRQG